MALTIQQLRKRYGENEAVRGVSLSVERGEVVGLLGPNGAGKSTTVGMIYGFVQPDSGSVLIDNIDIFTSGRAARENLGIVTQDDLPDGEFTVQENLEHFAAFYGLSTREAKSRTQSLLERFHLTEHRDKFPEQLSGGLRRRLVLARALLGSPSYLCLDEPTTGLDPDARQLFWKHIRELKDEGRGILLTTHYMDEAERLCDRVVLLQHGTVLDIGTPAELIQRTAGEVILETEIQADEVQATGGLPGALWSRPYGSGSIIGGERSAVDAMFLQLSQRGEGRLTRRTANLEDVFLKVSGDRLG